MKKINMKKELSMPYAIIISTVIICITFFVTSALFFNQNNRYPKIQTPPNQQMQIQNKDRIKVPEKPSQPTNATSSVQ